MILNHISIESKSLQTAFCRDVEDLGELIAHALRALRDCLPNDTELTTKNVSVGYVGRDVEFTMKDDDDVEEYLKVLPLLSPTFPYFPLLQISLRI
jgi:20S proteasome alpha/beta subunit